VNLSVAKLNNYFRKNRRIVISICLNSQELKAAAVELGDDNGVGYSYHKDFSASEYGDRLAPPWYHQEEILEACLTEIRAGLELEEYRMDEAELVVMLEEMACVERLELPNLEQQELEEAIAWELPQRLAWEQDSYTYKYTKEVKPLETEKKAKDKSLQLITIYSIPKLTLEKLSLVFNKLGLVVNAVLVNEELEEAKVDFAEQINSMDFYESFYDSKKLMELRLFYGQTIRAALAYSEGLLEINFLSSREQRRSLLILSAPLCRILALSLLGLSIGLGAVAEAWERYEEGLWQQSKSSYERLLPWKAKQKNLAALEKQVKQLQTSKKLLEQEKIGWSRQLLQLGASLPSGCWLVKIEQVGEENKQSPIKRLELQGRAEASELVMQLIKNLKQSKLYSKVELLNTGQEQAGRGAKGKRLQSFRILLQLISKDDSKELGAVNKLKKEIVK